ncbi:unnamed protein product [Closterium sp. Yama58-4]|nr:unnamed protein product [Closterium sp. Yama58-4]
MGSLPGVVCEFCNRWFPNAQVYGGHKSRRTPCQGLSAVARPSRSAPSAGLHALLFVHDILSDAPAAPASPTASNASNTDGANGPHRVPVADEDATPSAVNVGAPETEHQPSPETPADDTSEHQGCRPGVSHAAPPTIISGESNATPLSPIALELLHFVRRVNGGMGMAEIDINGLLQLVVEPGLAPLVISEIRNCKDLERFEMERLVGLNRGWSVATFEIEGHPPQRLLFQNSAQAFAELFGHTNNAPGFKLKARVDEDPDTGERRYTTPETGTWWNDAQVCNYPAATQNHTRAHASVDALMYMTHMSNNGRKKAWPLMMTLANISQAKRWGKAGHTLLALLPIPPSAMTAVEKVMLFQRCVITVLQPLLDGMDRVVLAVAVPTLPFPRSGLRLKDPFGDWQTVRPLLYAWVCDYPESGKISCTLSHRSWMPCSICYAAKEHLVAVKARNTPRTPEQQQWIVNEAAGLTSSQADPCKTYSTYPVEGEMCTAIALPHMLAESLIYPSLPFHTTTPPLVCAVEVGCPRGNPYLVIMPDIMHQADLGMMSHIVAVVRKMKKRRVKQMDRRLSLIRDRTRLNHLRLPESAYFESGACVAAYEHRAVMQVCKPWRM